MAVHVGYVPRADISQITSRIAVAITRAFTHLPDSARVALVLRCAPANLPQIISGTAQYMNFRMRSCEIMRAVLPSVSTTQKLSVLIIFSALTACAAISGVEPTKITKIERGMSREQAELILGTPVNTTETKQGIAAVYEYNKGGPPVIDPNSTAYFLLAPFTWPFAEHAAASRQKGILTILYDHDQQVVSAFDSDQREALRGIAAGDPGTLFNMGRRSKPGSKLQFLWYCYAAQKGHPVAQYLLAARFYEYGRGRINRSPEKAYLWYSLASRNGDKTAALRLKSLKPSLSTVELKQVEKLIESWEPDAASCKRDVGTWEGDAEAVDLLERLVGLLKKRQDGLE